MEKNVKDLTFADLAKMARQEAEAFATFIIGQGPTHKTAREVRYYDNQSLAVFISGPKQGKFKSFTDDDARGDLFDLYRYVRGGTAHDAVESYKTYAGLHTASPGKKVEIKRGPTPEENKRAEEEEIARRRKKAQWIWNNASATDGREEGLTYLRNRGINIEPSSDSVRFSRLSRDDLEKMNVPASDIPTGQVVAVTFAATDESGQISAVQRVFTTEGKKVSFENPKRSNGSLIGSSVKLGESGDQDTLIIAEGPETALSLHQATGKPCRITLGTSNYTNIDMPPWVKTLIIAADMDESGAGLAAALKAAQYWSRRGVEKVGIAIPRLHDGDFNDVLQRSGDEIVRKTVEKSFFPDRTRNDDVVLATPDAKVAFHAWMRTGVATAVRIPPLNKKTDTRSPINLEGLLDEQHRTVLVVNKDGFTFNTEYVDKHRQDVQVMEIEDTAETFLANASDPAYVRRIVSRSDIYAPDGCGKTEPLAISLRRKDTDALVQAGHRAIAIRPSELLNLDFSFMKGRKAIVAPLGRGTPADELLCQQLQDAGADVTRLAWQLFHPTPRGLKIVRDDIPKDYGAAEAVSEGWKGKAMADLLVISEAAQRQQVANATSQEAAPAKQGKQ